MKEVVILGAGGHAVSVANVILAAGDNINCFVDPAKTNQKLLGLKIIADLGSLKGSHFYYAVAIGDNLVREKLIEQLASTISMDRFANFIHPTASVGINVELGYGNIVMPNATVGPSSVLGDFCILNTNSSIDHNCVMGSFSSVAPGAHTGGNVRIGRRGSVSIGAIVKQDIVIGQDAIVGVAAYVDENVSPNSVVYGAPARHVRYRC